MITKHSHLETHHLLNLVTEEHKKDPIVHEMYNRLAGVNRGNTQSEISEKQRKHFKRTPA